MGLATDTRHAVVGLSPRVVIDRVVHARRRFARERSSAGDSSTGAMGVEALVGARVATAGGRLADRGVLPIIPSGHLPILRATADGTLAVSPGFLAPG
jgi:hypothetical protein